MTYTESTWNGFRRLDFTLDAREAILVLPETAEPGRRWLLKTEYFGAFPDFEIEMLHRGFHLAYIKNKTRWHHPSDDDAKERLCAHLAEEFSLAGKCMPVGMSCGCMHAIYFAAAYPARVGALYLDAPVTNLLSCPGGVGAAAGFLAEFTAQTGMTLVDLIGYRNHPIDNIAPILENRIPVLMISGDSDTVVPYAENGAYMTAYFRKNGGDLTEILKPGGDHHPHGLSDPAPIIDFALNKYKGD